MANLYEQCCDRVRPMSYKISISHRLMDFALTPKSFWYSARPRNKFPNYHKHTVPALVIGTAAIAAAASSPPPVPPPGTIAAFFYQSAKNVKEAVRSREE